MSMWKKEFYLSVPSCMNKVRKITFLLISFFGIGFLNPIAGQSQESLNLENDFKALLPGINGSWAKSVLDTLSLDAKIGQLFMIPVWSNRDEKHFREIENLLKQYQIGGLILMQGGPGRQTNLINRLNSTSNLPLLLSQDAEWGINMRLDSTLKFPKNMTLGAISDLTLIEEFGYQLAIQCKSVGINIDFAPVIDVNNNPLNPVINDRSFGENRERVAEHGLAIMNGLMRGNVLPCAKHFPGHGDTDTDSHLDLPVLSQSETRLNRIELYPFRQLFSGNVPSVMIAHLFIPALDNSANTPASLSKPIITDFLKNTLQYNGLVFTDALNMKGVTKFYPPGELELKALQAGNDVLLFSEHVPDAIKYIKNAILDSILSEETINEHVYKILLTKEWLTSGTHIPVPLADTINYVSEPDVLAFKSKLYRESITVLGKKSLIPLHDSHLKKGTCYVQLSSNPSPNFIEYANSIYPSEIIVFKENDSAETKDSLLSILKNYHIIILSLGDLSRKSAIKFNLKDSTISILNKISSLDKDVVLIFPGNPYALNLLPSMDAVVICYEEDPMAIKAATDVVFGGYSANGKLPVTSSAEYTEGEGALTHTLDRIAFCLPEEVGFSTEKLIAVDSFIENCIEKKAMPGCAILAMKNNKIFYHKGFGKTDYSEWGYPINPSYTAYDLASITKVASTTLCAMKLYEEGMLSLEQNISFYLPEFNKTDKKDIKIKELLYHTSGLPAFVPFYLKTMDKEGNYLPGKYSAEESSEYSNQISSGLFSSESLKEEFWQEIKKCKIENRGKVLYSDVGMIILSKILEKLSGMDLPALSDSLFYSPLHLKNTFFLPENNKGNLIFPPTGNDTYWRKSIVQGFVHDPSAALLGGYSGNAGLFSTIYDLSRLGLMLLKDGKYGGTNYLKKETIQLFTKRHSAENRKGLGFDRADFTPEMINPVTELAGENTFGHLGFTGTSFWIDKDNDMVFIFLSNRTFPDAENKTFSQLNVRGKTMELIYSSKK